MKTILITGGAGFIGSNFTRYLFQHYPDYRLIVLDALTYAGNLDNFPVALKTHPNFTFWHGDVRDSALVLELTSQADAVVHFAAETHVARSIYDDRRFFETDVLGTQCVASAVLRCRDRIERFLHISSSEVYGTAATVPMTEQHPLNPMSPYAAAKAGADRLVYSYCTTYAVPAVILRPFNQYGPYQHLEKVIPRFITSAILNEPLTLHGRGEARRDWLHVEDTCRRIDLALHAPIERIQGQAIHLGSGEARDIRSIARLILRMLHKPESLISFMDERPGQVQHHCSSQDRARELLGIEPGRPFEAGLEETIRWYRDHPDWWRKQLNMRRVPIKNGGSSVRYY